MLRRPSRAWAASGVLLTVVATAAAGCGGGTSSPPGRVVDVTERDFRISVSETHLRAGTVVFRAHNVGPDAHELIVVRTDGGRLRLRADGMTVDEEGLRRSIVGTLEAANAGAVRELSVRLRPGRYALFCNMSGHYMGGMEATVVVA